MTAAGAFVKFSRDKRGYEHFYLVLPTTNRRGRSRTRILYWFRTPPGVRVGRLPFDDDMRRAIEAQNPGVSFDWKRLVATPVPPPAPDVEHWRERRRAERAERAVRRGEEPAEREAEDVEPSGAPIVVQPEIAAVALMPDVLPESESEADPVVLEPVAVAAPSEAPARRRRRRRRGGRGHRRLVLAGVAGPAPSGVAGPAQSRVEGSQTPGAPPAGPSSKEPPPAAEEPGEE